MTEKKNVLLLVGSPRGEKSTSASLGIYLVSKLEEYGMTSEIGFIHRLVNRDKKIQELFRMVENADLIILSFPLYVDSLPAPVIKAMELINEERDRSKGKKTHSIIAICNNGFPEASQNKTALQICRIFARDCGFKWKGGIALGGGGAIAGIPLEEKGGMVRNVISGLDQSAHSLSMDQEIPQETIDLLSKKFIPYPIYRIFGNLGWKLQARRLGARKRMKDKPYSN
ncbi:MAG: NAD(P)H-dependent oxidoreductase [Promethearchaeota archaeon]|jgi:hypothetical protein